MNTVWFPRISAFWTSFLNLFFTTYTQRSASYRKKIWRMKFENSYLHVWLNYRKQINSEICRIIKLPTVKLLKIHTHPYSKNFPQLFVRRTFDQHVILEIVIDEEMNVKFLHLPLQYSALYKWMVYAFHHHDDDDHDDYVYNFRWRAITHHVHLLYQILPVGFGFISWKQQICTHINHIPFVSRYSRIFQHTIRSMLCWLLS